MTTRASTPTARSSLVGVEPKPRISNVGGEPKARNSLIDLDLETALRLQVSTRNADLPVLPATAVEALRLVRNPRVRTDELLQVVELDPPLAARILAVANSSYYARGNAIRSLRQAVVRLGLHALRDVIYMAIYASTLFDAPGLVDIVRETFDHSVVVARFAQRLAPHVGIDDETAFLAGLIHDVGRARCCKVLSKLPQAKGRAREELLPIIDRYHESAGAALAVSWNLPQEVADACEHHHAPVTPIGCLIAAADAVAYVLEHPESSDREALEIAVARLGMTGDEALELFSPLRAELAARVSTIP